MEEFVDKVCYLFDTFKLDAYSRAMNGDKAAGARSRKASLELEKLFKEWRKISVKEEVK
jgi:hypothetical protein